MWQWDEHLTLQRQWGQAPAPEYLHTFLSCCVKPLCILLAAHTVPMHLVITFLVGSSPLLPLSITCEPFSKGLYTLFVPSPTLIKQASKQANTGLPLPRAAVVQLCNIR